MFPLGVVTAWDGQTFSIFGNQPDPGTLAPYRAVRDEDCWGAVKNTARYQHLVNRPGCTGPDEWLQKIGDVYAHAAVIGANLDPISGDAPGRDRRTRRRSSSIATATRRAARHWRPAAACRWRWTDLVDTVGCSIRGSHPHFAIGPTS